MRKLMLVSLMCAAGLVFAADKKAKKEATKGTDKPAAAEAPASAVEPAKSEAPEFIMLDKTGKLAPVKFAHTAHGKKNTCKDCHEGEKPLFLQKRNEAGMKMADMYAGKTCGSCHNGKNKVFAAKSACAKCHKKEEGKKKS